MMFGFFLNVMSVVKHYLNLLNTKYRDQVFKYYLNTDFYISF